MRFFYFSQGIFLVTWSLTSTTKVNFLNDHCILVLTTTMKPSLDDLFMSVNVSNKFLNKISSVKIALWLIFPNQSKCIILLTKTQTKALISDHTQKYKVQIKRLITNGLSFLRRLFLLNERRLFNFRRGLSNLRKL